MPLLTKLPSAVAMHHLVPPSKAVRPPGPAHGAQPSPCSEVSLKPAQESWPSDTSLVFTSLNQTVHIFSGCQQDFGASLALAGHRASPCSKPGVAARSRGCTNLRPNSSETTDGLRWPCFCSHPGETWLPALHQLRQKTYLLLAPKLC